MISTIMISYLGDYPGARSNPEQKFIRAVDSFINQTIGPQNSELVIVSDGCERTNRLYDMNYRDVDNIQLIKKPKARKGIFPGSYRQEAINSAKFDYITYLDSDDFFLPNRLELVYDRIKNSNRVIVVDNIYCVPNIKSLRITFPHTVIDTFEYDGIDLMNLKINWTSGTFQLTHKKKIGAYWKDGSRGEDYAFTDAVYRKHNIVRKGLSESIGGYVVCHHPKFGWDI